MNKKLLSIAIGLILSSGVFALDHPPTDEDIPSEQCPSEPCIKPPSDQNHPSLSDFDVSEEHVCSLDMNNLINLPPEALGAFNPTQFECMPPPAFGGMTSEQMQHIQPDVLAQMTLAQFVQLPPQALHGLHHDNMDHLPPGILQQMKPEHLGQLDIQEFQQLSSKGIINIVINLDPTLIIPSIIKELLPEGWDIQEDGTLMPPPLSEIELPPLPQEPTNCLNSSDAIPDLSKGFGLGGQGQSVLAGINLSLAQVGYPQLTVEQKNGGILQVTGSGELAGVVIALKPWGNSMIQADSQTPAGVDVGKGGEFVVTTPEGRQVAVTPSPKDTCAVSDALGEENPIQMDASGEMLLTAEDEKPVPCVFDQFVLPASPDLPVGLHVPPGGKGKGHFVYPDGTMQQIHPTVHKPAQFIATGLEFEGVEEITHQVDGTLAVKFLGQPLILKPTFEVTQIPLPTDANERPDPKIEVKDASLLVYSVPEDSCGCILEQEIDIFSAE